MMYSDQSAADRFSWAVLEPIVEPLREVLSWVAVDGTERPAGGILHHVWNWWSPKFPSVSPLDADPSDEDSEETAIPVAVVGAFRRRSAWLGKLEFLFGFDDAESLFDQIESASFCGAVLSRSPTVLTFRLGVRPWVGEENGNGGESIPEIPVRCFVAPPASFGAAMLFRSASPPHLERLVAEARERGFSLTPDGLFRDDQLQRASSDESEIYAALGYPFFPPESRSGGGEFTPGFVPENLVRVEMIRGDLHLHTRVTDGTGTIEEMATMAIRRQLDYIALTDHSPRVFMAGGMDAPRVRAYWGRIDRINRDQEEAGSRFRILKGIEVDVLADGALDLPDELLADADWVVASLHFDLEQPQAMVHHRIERALAHPFVCVLAHPTARWYGLRGLNLDDDFLLETAAKQKKFLEINAQPRRLDLDWRLARRAKEAGILLVISTDAHAPEQMEYLRYGVDQGRKAGLTPDDVLNTRSLTELLAARPPAYAMRDRDRRKI